MENKNYMKSLVKLAFSLFAGMCMVVSCNDSDDENISGFTLDAQEFTLGAEGGTETVKVASGTKWVAKVNKPWVKVMPANGVGVTECQIVVDSTLLSDGLRNAVVTFVPEGQEKQEVQIKQIGFGNIIDLSKNEVSVVNMGDYGKRYFEISVTTNVDFDVNIPAGQGWISSVKTPVSLDGGARPRTTKVRFNWDMNTDPLVREAVIKFTPVDPSIIVKRPAVLTVTQEAAPVINDDRTGDSIAILLIGVKMNALLVWDTSEKMDYWDGVTLWEKTDENVTEEQIGRVRSVGFAMLSTKEVLPTELRHLKYLETLSISGNGNKMLLPDNFFMGDALTNLKHLKHLRISGYGLTELRADQELREPMKTLESVDFSSNHFTKLPGDLTPNKFPNLKSINLIGMRRHDYNLDLRDNVWQPNWGMRIHVSELNRLFLWEKLVVLRLSYNYIYGQFPAVIAEAPYYTDADIALSDTIQSASPENLAKLKTIQRVMPKMEVFSINLNFLTGNVPDWLFYHPRFANFIPFTFVYTQDSGYDTEGKVPRIDNEPANLDDFYKFYPLAAPKKTE